MVTGRSNKGSAGAPSPAGSRKRSLPAKARQAAEAAELASERPRTSPSARSGASGEGGSARRDRSDGDGDGRREARQRRREARRESELIRGAATDFLRDGRAALNGAMGAGKEAGGYAHDRTARLYSKYQKDLPVSYKESMILRNHRADLLRIRGTLQGYVATKYKNVAGLFGALDLDCDGKISMSDWLGGCKMLNFPISEDDARKMFNAIDVNQDNGLDVSVFVPTFRRATPGAIARWPWYRAEDAQLTHVCPRSTRSSCRSWSRER